MVTIQDAGLRSAPDERLIDHAREENRVIVTNDTDILGIVASRPHPGVIFQTTQFVDPGDLLGAIVRLLNTIPDPAFENNVFYVP